MWQWFARWIRFTPGLGERVDLLESWKKEHQTFHQEFAWDVQRQTEHAQLSLQHQIARLVENNKRERDDHDQRMLMQMDAMMRRFEHTAMSLVRTTVEATVREVLKSLREGNGSDETTP